MALLRVRVPARIQAGLSALLMSGASQEERLEVASRGSRGSWGESRSQIINSDKSLGQEDYNN